MYIQNKKSFFFFFITKTLLKVLIFNLNILFIKNNKKF